MTVSQVPLRSRSIRYVRGVGPQRLTQLAHLGIQTIEDACYYPPRRYEDRTRMVPIRQVVPGEMATIRGRIRAKGLRRVRRGLAIVEAALEDESGVAYARWFHQPYLAQQLVVGEELILYGRVEGSRHRPQLVHPEMERVSDEEGGDALLHMGRIVPVYPLTSGVGQRWFRQVIATVLERDSGALEDPLPESLRWSRQWPSLSDAIRQLHFPDSWEQLSIAQQRLAFEELLLFQVALAKRQAKARMAKKPQRYELEGAVSRGLRERLPFRLTEHQERVVKELFEDLGRPYPMQRLLQGDVGCGKTVVMLLLIAAAVQSGYQVALMAPTELLAEQHARVAAGLLEPLGVKMGVLSQAIPAPLRKQRLAAIAAGEVSVVIGTHALIQRDVAFQRLALVIIDEQHKFGVAQRAALAKKAKVPDVLVVTATPIPRTLALSMYGDLDVSTIAQLPSGRRPITTRWMPESQRAELYRTIRQQLAEGRQGYVVYPLVEESASRDLKAATQMARRLQSEVFPEFRIGLLHGQMKPKDKEAVMSAFASGTTHLLVSTVIVEVGLDVTNATIMVIEHPERFGLAQLHQLRGRIGRGAHSASCIVVSDVVDAMSRQRLAAFVQTADGFELAERDLELRGPGELLGRRQHGWARFRIANLCRDKALLESARQEAQTMVRQDPELRHPSLAVLRERLVQAYRPQVAVTPHSVSRRQ